MPTLHGRTPRPDRGRGSNESNALEELFLCHAQAGVRRLVEVNRRNPARRNKWANRIMPCIEMVMMCRHDSHIDRHLYSIVDAIPIEECTSATGHCL